MSGLVHVSAYTQSRHGNAVNVSSYDRSGPAGGGRQPPKKPWEGKTNQGFREKISEDESSGGKPDDGYKERNTQGTGALGRYQLKNAALKDAGWKDAQGNWTEKARKHGVNSDSDFLDHPEAQEAALGDVMRGVERQLNGNGSTQACRKDLCWAGWPSRDSNGWRPDRSRPSARRGHDASDTGQIGAQSQGQAPEIYR